jgi:hypothetical protein
MGDFLKGVGILGFLAGAYFVFTALNMSVEVGNAGQQSVVNLGLMQSQMLEFLLGALLGLGGVLGFIAGAIVDQIKDQADRVIRNEQPTP